MNPGHIEDRTLFNCRDFEEWDAQIEKVRVERGGRKTSKQRRLQLWLAEKMRESKHAGK